MNEEIIQLLKTDPAFALKFALDNNFPAIQQKLVLKGFIVNSPAEAFTAIMQMIQQGKNLDVKELFNVPYINSATNGTGGLSNYFILNSAPPVVSETDEQGRFNWSGLLTTIGIVVTGVGVSLGTTTPTTPLTAEQQAAADAAEAAEKRKSIIMWSLIIGIPILILILWLIFKKKKAKTT